MEKYLVRSLAASIIKHKKIHTTFSKAKKVQPFIEKIIHMSKNKSVHNRRQLIKQLNSKNVANELLSINSNKKNGGYTRIVKTYNRKGDNALMAYIELLDIVPSINTKTTK